MKQGNRRKLLIINFRPLFCMFIGMIAGIFTCALLFRFDINNLLLVFVTILSCIFLISVTLFEFIKIERIKFIMKFIFTITLGVIIGVLGCNIKINDMINYPVENGSYTISARVMDITKTDTGVTYILENVKVDDIGYNFNINLFVSNNQISQDINLGDNVAYSGKLTKIKLFNNSKINSSLSKNIKYSSSLKELIKVSEGYLTFSDNIKTRTNQILNNNTNSDFASLCYSLLFGEKDTLDTNLYNMFQNCGIAHILAVSGLHIALITAILIFLLKKFKCNKILSLILVSLFLFMYAILCGFTASVCRASIMSITYMIADIIGERKDMLSTFSFAGIIILLIFPLQIFSVGFQLSFGCVTGIILLANTFTNLLGKLRLPNFIKSGLVITSVSTISTLPIISNTFGVFYPISFISNLIILPLFTIAFSLLFVFTIINLVLPFGFLYSIITHLFNIIISLSGVLSIVGGINLMRFSLISMIIYYLILLIVSRFINLRINIKFITCMILTIILSVNLVLMNFNRQYNKDLLICDNITNFTILTTRENKTYIVGLGENGGENEYYNIKNCLIDKGIKDIDGLILITFDTKQQDNFINICKDFYVKKVVIDEDIDEDLKYGIKKNFDKDICSFDFENEYQLDSVINISSVSYNNIKFGAVFSCNNVKIAMICKDLTNNRVNTIIANNYDKVIVNENNSHYFDNAVISRSYSQDYFVSFNN